MVKLRKQRRRKTYRHNVNRKRMRNKITSTGVIACKQIKDQWEDSKSIRKNMTEMGLCYDPNRSISLKKRKPKTALVTEDDDNEWEEEMVEESNVSTAKSSVAEELVKEARAPRVKMFRLPKSQIEWLTYLLDKFGTDYKAMERDKKNYNQETWKQLRAKIKRFKSIPEQFGEYLKKSGKSVESFDVTDVNGDSD